ncbi:MAG: 3-deoxy-manno-octulosonate cytidylyltransferase [Methylotenera sp. 24-45-7]|jgi:3-deoxy-manno-octulosonate cytidylyltransferase (CMP-KDO synthetase)|nr:MAG: 3-deoxy-manno-octulosonate cytidylyltransferase [Methylotenera sp. 24-45-7]OZA07667.1 MAG: 3-deoxy-manno-octulosonate cytidylyltransferase [Methylotenera sp. 17-45-7]HQS44449.1 3-deoxy-manno-octulosonate cytidylyltransferase [Methylotenera sp.]
MASTSFYVVIPARYASTRLPGKPLLDIAGKPMVVHVADKAKQSGASKIVVATDDARIEAVVQGYGYSAVLTRQDHVSGTDRIAEVAIREAWSDDAIVVNVQGDEPLIDPALIVEVAETLANNKEAVMATACHVLHSKADFLNPNIVKVVLDKNGNALYFSRAPIPYPRDAFATNADVPKDMPIYRHIGLYAYRTKFLKQYAQIPAAAIEQFESLEQLRVLYQGYKIAVAISERAPAAGVDTEADLAYVRSLLA